MTAVDLPDFAPVGPDVLRCGACGKAMDVLGGFIAECCVLGPRYTVPKAALYAGYEKWCEGAGEKAASKRVFTQRLTGRGIGEDRTGHERVRAYRGIQLRTDADTSSVYSPMREDHRKEPDEVSASVRSSEDPFVCVECGAAAGLEEADGMLYCRQHLPVAVSR